MVSLKTCPIDAKEEDAKLAACPEAGGDLVRVTVDEPQPFQFCSRCRRCWSGVLLEAGRTYQLETVGNPVRWRDGSWTAETVEQALRGWRDLSDFPNVPWWERLVKGPAVWISAKTRRVVRDADWFQIFMVVREVGSKSERETTPERLVAASQSFTPSLSGELYLFVNDDPSRYTSNNEGRMSLRISLVD